LPLSISHASLPTLPPQRITIGAKPVTHTGYTSFQPAEVSVPTPLILAILTRIRRLAETMPM